MDSVRMRFPFSSRFLGPEMPQSPITASAGRDRARFKKDYARASNSLRAILRFLDSWRIR